MPACITRLLSQRCLLYCAITYHSHIHLLPPTHSLFLCLKLLSPDFFCLVIWITQTLPWSFLHSHLDLLLPHIISLSHRLYAFPFVWGAQQLFLSPPVVGTVAQFTHGGCPYEDEGYARRYVSVGKFNYLIQQCGPLQLCTTHPPRLASRIPISMAQ